MAERPPGLRGTDKLAFLLALVPWLMDHDQVTVQEAARQFGVTDAQIREAVNLIAVSGVPGDTSQYQHGDLFDIAWDRFEEHDEIVLTNLVAIDDSPRFSGREAAALIAGLQYLSALPEISDRTVIDSLMTKLARGASAPPSSVAVAPTDADATLAVIRDAVAAGLQVEFDYLTARGDREERHVDPLRIESADADWYLRGWDHRREAVRTFRLDRITNLVPTVDPIVHRPSDVTLPDALFVASSDDLLVTVDVAPSALPLIADYIPAGTRAAEVDGRVRTVIRVSHFHGLKRLVARFAGVVEVVEPSEAREVVRKWADDGLARYRD